MAVNLPLQSSFLYHGKWSHEIDSTIIGTMLRLKQEYGCDGSVFPSHFIFEAQSAVEYEHGLTFEWWELVDRIHFLEKRYKTFTELIHLEGTFWNEPNNTIIVSSQTWATRLPENHLLGAYHSHGDPAYSKLRELFELVAIDNDVGGTLIILSDSVSTQAVVCDAPVKNRRPVEMAEASSSNKFSCARRKLMFDDGGPLDLESTNKKAERFFIPGKDGQMEMVEKKVTGRILERDFPPKSPTLAYSCGSSNPVPKWRMPRKPNV